MIEELIGGWLSTSKSKTTRGAYLLELKYFGDFLVRNEMDLQDFLALDYVSANDLVRGYRDEKIRSGKSTSTVNRATSAVASLVSFARASGKTTLCIDKVGVKRIPVKDMRGPSPEEIEVLFAEAAMNVNPHKATRDTAILLLGLKLGLRRLEICQIDIGDIDLAGKTIAIAGKGRNGKKEKLSLDDELFATISRLLWFRRRDAADQPLFVRLRQSSYDGGRLTGDGIHSIITKLAERNDITARPHGLRHSAITQAIEESAGSYNAVQKFSRLRSLDSIGWYDDRPN